jgi:hypothetical protein
MSSEELDTKQPEEKIGQSGEGVPESSDGKDDSGKKKKKSTKLGRIREQTLSGSAKR